MGACGGGGGQAAISGPREPAPSPATTAPPPPTSIPAASSTTAQNRPSSSTAAAPSTSAAARPTTTAGPSALRPAAPGTYRYDTSGQSRLPTGTTPLPAVTSLVVDPPAGTTQHSARDLRDPARNGPVFEFTLDYRPDGIYLNRLAVTTTLLLFSASEELRPPSPVLLLPNGAAPGYHRELDLPTPEGNTAHLVLDVLRNETVTVAGQRVATSVIRLTATLSGDTAGRLELTVWLSRDRSLWVKEQLVAAASESGGFDYHAEYDATIQRLTPS